ncbi:type IV pilin N-terminal domain-containing protein [Candidatus Pacearchaeota archaeon]|nr:type IV pilin N-terminal domain-containing protein [Candidatus Pacearchaeota archaeon]
MKYSSNKIKKKALSSVVATILLVMLTIIAVAIIAGFIIPFVSDSLNEGTECVDYTNYFIFEDEFGYNCYSQVDGENFYAISVGVSSAKSESEEKIKGFKLAFQKTGGSEVADVLEGEPTSGELGGIRMLDSAKPIIEIPKGREVRTYVYRTTETFESVGISPILKSGRLCDQTDKIRVSFEICENPIDV